MLAMNPLMGLIENSQHFGMGGVARKDPLMSQSSFQAVLNIAGLVRTLT